MKKNTILILLLLCLISYSYSQTNKAWKPVKQATTKLSKNVLRQSFPDDFALFELDTESIRVVLATINDKSSLTSKSGKIIYFPNTEGNLERFEVIEHSNFDPILQNQFPQIRSYLGIGVDDKQAQIRFSMDQNGLQAMIFRVDKRNEFIESYTEDGKIYALYNSSRTKGNLPFTCSTDDHAVVNDLDRGSNLLRSNSGELLTFRLAISCNGEYTQYFGGTVAGALAAMNATMTRVNGVFEKDLAIRMNIIANNSSVIYTNPFSDPYTTMANWNNQLQTTLTNLIGEANYDVGHMFGATGGGGNAGCIGCVCETGKGRGITSPSDGVPSGDTFDIDYVAHELGHQFGGNHTFSQGVEGSGVNVEPGSGSTIMGYAGITAQDVQPNSDDYFVYASIKQIQDNMVGKTCPVRTTLTNNAPVTNAGLDYIIPKSTPFVLSGSAVDANGNPLTYCWEQNDTATTQTGFDSAASATKTGGPNWRSYSPVSSPKRYCPSLTSVIANQSTTQGAEIIVEALSSVARTLNFVLTAKDNVLGASQTDSDEMLVTVNQTAGPFLVTAPNTSTSWQAGTNQTVTWDVAGTTTNGVNAAYVDIYLSTDGGFNYPILLASNVPNDGTETITVPNNVGATNRVMVKGNNHIFYDISNNNFSIIAAASGFSVSYDRTSDGQNIQACTGSSVSYTIPYITYGGFTGATTFSISGQPSGTTVTFSPASVNVSNNVTMTISNTGAATAGLYSIVVMATSGAIIKTVPLYFNLFNSNFSSLTLTSPANLAVGQPTSVNLLWNVDSNSTIYDIEVATNNTFSNIIATATVTTNSYALTGLLEATDYFWRVLPRNSSCSGVFSTNSKFTTGQIICNTFTATNVPIAIPTTANVTVNSVMNVASTVTLADVNVSVNISHTWVNDMIITLISPAGTQVQLVANPCSSASLSNIVATFDNAGVNVVCGNNPAISGTVIPFQTLSAFNGEVANGNWTLRVLDLYNQDGGSINGWSLNLCNAQAPLSVNENNLENFVLYPNPNKGNFTVQFNAASNNDVAIVVNDIRGRQIFKKMYLNTGLFSQNLQLDSVQAGIYLVTVTNGEKKEVKKIVIE